jgi:hypothetical protein
MIFVVTPDRRILRFCADRRDLNSKGPTMFTREEYIQQLPQYLARPLVPSEYWFFDARDVQPGTEATVQIARAETFAFDTGLHFFINTLRIEQGVLSVMGDHRATPDDPTFTPYTQEGAYRPLTEAAWVTLVEQLVKVLPHPPALPIALSRRTPFVAAVEIYLDWNEIAVVAEVGGIYLAIFWNTGA